MFFRVTLAVLVSAYAVADGVYLKNGDHLSGQLTSMDEGTVHLKTDYAGELCIQRASVLGVETDAPMALQLTDGSVVEAVAGFRANTFLVDGEPCAWESIAAIAATVDAFPGAEGSEEKGEAKKEEEKAKRWSGSVDMGLSLRTGNTDKSDVTFSGTTARKGAHDTLTLNFTSAYGEAEDVLNTRRMKGDIKWQVYPRERLYLFVTTSAERDDGRKLDLRTQWGGGVGYDFIENEKRNLSADIGANFTYERWEPFTPWERTKVKDERRLNALSRLASYTPGTSRIQSLRDFINILLDIRNPLRNDETTTEEFGSLSLTGEYEQQVFKDSTLSEKMVLLPNLEEMGEFRFNNELAFTTPISEALNLRMNLKSEYDSMADDKGVDAWDNTLLTTLNYKF